MGTVIKKLFIRKKIVQKRKGLKIGIDFSLYLKKYLAVYKTDTGSPFSVKYMEKQIITSHFYGFFKNFSQIAEDNHLFFIIDDNFSLEIKKETRSKRKIIEEKREEKIKQYLQNPETLELARKQIRGRTNFVIDYPLLEKIFLEIGWQIIKAKEADSEKYGANLVVSGFLDYFITNDSDTLLFGSDYVTNYKVNRRKDLQLQVVSLGDTLLENKINYDVLVKAGIVSGTDYSSGIKNIGCFKSISYVKRNQFPKEVSYIYDYFTKPVTNVGEINSLTFSRELLVKWKTLLKIK